MCGSMQPMQPEPAMRSTYRAHACSAAAANRRDEPAQPLIIYEHRNKPVVSRRVFFKRLAQSFSTGTAVIAVSLGVGMFGYHMLEGMHWLDAFVNAAMLLSGMGPLDAP